MNNEHPTCSAEFIYDGTKRIVEGVTIEEDTGTFIGLEKRKNGKFSNKIKRYSVEKAEELRIG